MKRIVALLWIALALMGSSTASLASEPVVAWRIGVISDSTISIKTQAGVAVSVHDTKGFGVDWVKQQDVLIVPVNFATKFVSELKSGKRVYFYGPNVTISDVFTSIGARKRVDVTLDEGSTSGPIVAVGLQLLSSQQWSVALLSSAYEPTQVVASLIAMGVKSPKTNKSNTGDASLMTYSDPNSYSQVAALVLTEEYKPYGKVIRTWNWYKASDTDTTKDYYVVHDTADMYSGRYLNGLGDQGYYAGVVNWAYSLKNKKFSNYPWTIQGYDPTTNPCRQSSVSVGWGTFYWTFSGSGVCIAAEHDSSIPSILWNVTGNNGMAQGFMPDHYKFGPGTKFSVPNGQEWVSYTTDHTATFQMDILNRPQYFKSWVVTFYDYGTAVWF